MTEEEQYWKDNYEKAMIELEKYQKLFFEMSSLLRELQSKIFGGSVK